MKMLETLEQLTPSFLPPLRAWNGKKTAELVRRPGGNLMPPPRAFAGSAPLDVHSISTLRMEKLLISLPPQTTQ